MASHEVGLGKPDAAIFRRYESEFGLAGQAILYFDDHLPNVQAARSVGWNAHQIDPEGDPVIQMSVVIFSLATA